MNGQMFLVFVAFREFLAARLTFINLLFDLLLLLDYFRCWDVLSMHCLHMFVHLVAAIVFLFEYFVYFNILIKGKALTLLQTVHLNLISECI